MAASAEKVIDGIPQDEIAIHSFELDHINLLLFLRNDAAEIGLSGTDTKQ